MGEGRIFRPSAEVRIQQLMQQHFPEQLNIDSALWTRSAVQNKDVAGGFLPPLNPSLIACECGVKMPMRTVGDYLKRWGYTPHKPLKRAYEQNPQAVKAWLETDYPAIEQQAKTEEEVGASLPLHGSEHRADFAEIAWGDESGLRSDAQVGRGDAPRGQTPEIQPNTQRVGVNYIASISHQGKVRFMLYTRKLTAQVCVRFLERLKAKPERKLMWIVDRHPVHRCEAVQQWLQAHPDKIEIHFLPPYSPQLNPAEYLNCDLKQGVHSQPPTRNLSQLKQRLQSHEANIAEDTSAIASYLFKLQKLPTRIIKYFQHPFIVYAA